jgi:formylglycine-generating enzyme required for sulfatase activity
MSEDNKKDDWGMTMPHTRLDDKAKESIKDFSPKIDAPTPPIDDWGVTEANVKLPPNLVPPANPGPSQPYSDFDKTVPNIDLPPQYQNAPKTPAAPTPPVDDWGMTQANVELPKEHKKDDWQMPQPVFRISSGETPSFDKTTPHINLRNAGAEDFSSPYEDDFGNKTTPYYRLPENQAAAPSVPPPVSEQFTTAEEKPAAAPSSGNKKWILLLAGLFVFFLVGTVGLLALYYFLIYDSSAVRSVQSNKTETNTAPTPAPTVAASANLPAAVNYKGEMVLVAAGDFTMGSDTAGDESKPAHQVSVPAFYIDKTEVTNAQYKEFCTATGKQPPTDPFWEKGYFEKRPNAPVLGVSFDDAKAYATWAGKRLPTEPEWEKAASWNPATQTKTDFPWGASFEAGKAAFGFDTTRDVGGFTSGASPSGALDMAGNVAEWVDAFFQPYPGNTSANPNFGETNRIVRGGHFGAKSNDNLKTTKRIYVPPTIASGEDEEKRAKTRKSSSRRRSVFAARSRRTTRGCRKA